jgi:hypothetical protein
LLARAGGGASLTEALHKCVKAGTVLGMMDGAALVLPRIQFVAQAERTTVAPGLRDVVRIFDDEKVHR